MYYDAELAHLRHLQPHYRIPLFIFTAIAVVNLIAPAWSRVSSAIPTLPMTGSSIASCS
ncbi:hypothetical protein [Dictyobacter vulcani]|uniref:hypothetical protein n=1 Tax=Dictyobacter vulcani TaxID=2607529 RepID=UPI001386A796|nr:hypothetical protein [Dictyobacter vulcani]